METEVVVYCTTCTGRVDEREKVFCETCFDALHIELNETKEMLEKLESEIEELGKELDEKR